MITLVAASSLLESSNLMLLIHHSAEARETNSNFGFNLPWWDRLFSTYSSEPEAGHENMSIDLTQFRTPNELRLDRMLVQSIRGRFGINRADRQ